MKKVLAILLALSMALVLFACAPDAPAPAADARAPAADAPAHAPEPEAPAEPVEQIFRVGVSLPPILNDYHANMREMILEEIDKAPPNFEFEVVGAADENDQVRVLEVFYEQNFDAVLISPFNGTLVAPIAEQIYNSGTVVVHVNRRMDTENYTSFVALDNYEAGRVAAIELGNYLGGEGTVYSGIMVAGTPIANERQGGFADEIAANWPGIEIIGESEFLNTYEGGLEGMQIALQAHPHIDAVYTHDDNAGMAAAQVIMDAGRYVGQGGDVQILITLGGTRRVFEELENPDQPIKIVIGTFPTMGPDGLLAVIDILEGRTVPKDMLTPPIIVLPGQTDAVAHMAY